MVAGRQRRGGAGQQDEQSADKGKHTIIMVGRAAGNKFPGGVSFGEKGGTGAKKRPRRTGDRRLGMIHKT